VVRLQPGVPRRDTLFAYSRPRLRPTRGPAGTIRVIAPGFPPIHAWGVFPDGRVIIVRGDQYQPEIVHPNGTRTTAPVIAYTPVRVTATERAAHLRDVEAEMRHMLRMELASAAKGGASLPRIEAIAPERWPTNLPALRDARILVDSRERAWVAVHDHARDAGDRYDLLDASGRRVDAVSLPPGVRLLAMGHGVIYATREDADGLVQLLRYPLP
jgi:hypothetical protein